MNWLAYNYAHDVKLPGTTGDAVGFFMYPQAEVSGERRDSLDPDVPLQDDRPRARRVSRRAAPRRARSA